MIRLWKFHNLKKARNKFNEVSWKFQEVSLLLSFMKFRKKRVMKLPTPTYAIDDDTGIKFDQKKCFLV